MYQHSHHRGPRKRRERRVGNVFDEICCCSLTQSCLTLCKPMDCNMPGFPVLHQLPELAQIHVHESLMPSNHLILCHPLLLLPSIFPSIRIFSNELALSIRWPKYWGFNLSPSKEYSGLISFRIDWFDLLAVQGTLKSQIGSSVPFLPSLWTYFLLFVLWISHMCYLLLLSSLFLKLSMPWL